MNEGRIVIAGGTGLLGSALIRAVRAEKPGCDVVVLTRGGHAETGDEGGARYVAWRPDAVDAKDDAEVKRLASIVDGALAVVNLAGTSIGAGRLGPAHLSRVRASRIAATSTLAEAVRGARRAPAAFVQGSAIGIYGDRGDEVLTDRATLETDGVLSQIARAWEAAAGPVATTTRLAVVRSAPALHPTAPTWQRMVLPVRLFVGGPLGNGRQWMSWITVEDHARALLHVIAHEDLVGPVNLTAPDPIRQATLVRAVASRLRRPAFLPLPAPLLRVVLGRLADATVLQSARVVPERLLASGFRFRHASFETALDYLLPLPRA